MDTRRREAEEPHHIRLCRRASIHQRVGMNKRQKLALSVVGGCEFRRFLNQLYYSHIWTFWPTPLMLLTKPCPDAQYDKEPSHDADSRSTVRAGVHRIYLSAPFDAQARAEMQTRLSPHLQSDPVGPLYGYAMEVHASTQGGRWDRLDPLHDHLQGVREMG